MPILVLQEIIIACKTYYYLKDILINYYPIIHLCTLFYRILIILKVYDFTG